HTHTHTHTHTQTHSREWRPLLTMRYMNTLVHAEVLSMVHTYGTHTRYTYTYMHMFMHTYTHTHTHTHTQSQALLFLHLNVFHTLKRTNQKVLESMSAGE